MATGKANDFVRENRADDKKFIVIKNQLVNGDIDFLAEQTTSNLFDFFGRDSTDKSECFRLVPPVIKKLHRSVLRAYPNNPEQRNVIIAQTR